MGTADRLGGATSDLNGASLVCLSTIDWDFLWQGHQEIMSRLAASGTRVLFVENCGVRTPGLRDAARLAGRLLKWWRARGAHGLAELRPGLTVLSPLLLPFPYSRAALLPNRALLLASIRRWLGQAERPLLWTFLPTPLALSLQQRLQPLLTIYYCVDDFASSSPAARRVRASEDALLRGADLVFVTSRRLKERAEQLSPHVSVYPFGLDLERFDQARQSSAEPPAAIRGLSRPIVCYVGGIHRWVDFELFAAVAQRLPQCTFVLIGPLQADASGLLRQVNVRWLGPQPHQDLPGLLKQADVGIIPYRRCEYTDHVHPTKLAEYLSLGLPVVATALPELVAVNDRHPGLLDLADDAGGFAEGIERALGGGSAAERQRRVEVARQSAWSVRFAAMMKEVSAALRERRLVS